MPVSIKILSMKIRNELSEYQHENGIYLQTGGPPKRKREITENEKPNEKDPPVDSSTRKNTNKNLAEEDFESNIMSLFGTFRCLPVGVKTGA